MMEFLLEPFRPEMAESLSRHGNDPDIARFMADQFPHPYTAEKAKAYIERVSALQPQRIFAIVVEGEAAGGIGLHPLEDINRLNAELGYWLGKKYHGKGIMTSAVRQICAYGFQNLPLTRIYARPFPHNPASIRVLEKSGFTFEARIPNSLIKNGEVFDELIYAIRK